MPEHAFGGDDSGSGAPAPAKPKKPGFGKFELEPDTNIRDLFWKIMGSYAAKKNAELDGLEHERFALMNVSLSILSSPHSGHYGLSTRFIMTYTLMMMIDANWGDAFTDFLMKSQDNGEKVGKNAILAIKKLMANEQYKLAFKEEFSSMLRDRATNEVALKYVAKLKDRKLTDELKKELLIFARGDIGENQMNAIAALTLLNEDEEVKKAFISLLSHWDSAARISSARALCGWKKDEEIKKAAAGRLVLETEPEVRKALERLTR